MSLEQALADNTAAMRDLIAVWSKLNNQAKAIDKSDKVDQVVAAGKPVEAATEKTAKETAKTKAETKPVEAETQQPEIETAAPAIDYATLQKAVFTLAGKSREAAAAVAASLGVKTFKELPADKWAEALGAVQEKLVELENV